jgi:hypothetical protein
MDEGSKNVKAKPPNEPENEKNNGNGPEHTKRIAAAQRAGLKLSWDTREGGRGRGSWGDPRGNWSANPRLPRWISLDAAETSVGQVLIGARPPERNDAAGQLSVGYRKYVSVSRRSAVR